MPKLTTMLFKDGTSESALGKTSRSIGWGNRLVCVPDLTGALDIWEFREETQTGALTGSARRELEARRSGGFAFVYKGTLSLGNGDLSVAVKVPSVVRDEQEYKFKKVRHTPPVYPSFQLIITEAISKRGCGLVFAEASECPTLPRHCRTTGFAYLLRFSPHRQRKCQKFFIRKSYGYPPTDSESLHTRSQT